MCASKMGVDVVTEGGEGRGRMKGEAGDEGLWLCVMEKEEKEKEEKR